MKFRCHAVGDYERRYADSDRLSIRGSALPDVHRGRRITRATTEITWLESSTDPANHCISALLTGATANASTAAQAGISSLRTHTSSSVEAIHQLAGQHELRQQRLEGDAIA